MKEVARCIINCADDKFSSQQTSQSASRGPVISSAQRTTVETQNRHPNVEQICTEGWFISIIRVCCVDAFMRTRVRPPCAACTKHVIHGDVIRIPPSRSQFSLVPASQGRKKKSTATRVVTVSGKVMCESGFKAHPAKHNREQVEEENTGLAR